MKISQTTLNVLKNFASISPTINVDEPNCFRILSPSENIIAVFDTEETFENFAIYDLPQIMGIISLFAIKETDFLFNKSKECVEIKSRNSKVKYNFTDKDLIPNVEKILPSKKYKSLDFFTGFTDFSKDDFSKIYKAAQIMRMSNMNVKISDKKCIVTVSDPSNPVSNDYKIVLPGTGECEINLSVDYLLMLSGDYSISIKSNTIMKLQHKELPLIYFVSANQL